MALSQNDHIEVNGKVSIPGTSAGMIIGRNGSVIRYLADSTGASISINEKGPSDPTSLERILYIGGTKKNCADCLAKIIMKLVDAGPEISAYEDNHHIREALENGFFESRHVKEGATTQTNNSFIETKNGQSQVRKNNKSIKDDSDDSDENDKYHSRVVKLADEHTKNSDNNNLTNENELTNYYQSMRLREKMWD